MPHDPIRDDTKLYTMAEWAAELELAVAVYVEALEGKNDFTQKPHTFNEWMRAFGGFMSF